MAMQFQSSDHKRYGSRKPVHKEGLSKEKLSFLVTEAFKMMYADESFLETLTAESPRPGFTTRF